MVRVSSVTTTCVAAGTAISISEEVIPSLQELFAILCDHSLDTPDFRSSEVPAVCETEWIQPNLCDAALAFYVHVRRFAAVTRIEEESIARVLENRRHPTSW